MAPLPVITGLGENFVRCFVNKVMMSKLVRIPSIFLCVVKAEGGCQQGHFPFRIVQVSINIITHVIMYSDAVLRKRQNLHIYTAFVFKGVLERIEGGFVCPLPITLPAIARTRQSKKK